MSRTLYPTLYLNLILLIGFLFVGTFSYAATPTSPVSPQPRQGNNKPAYSVRPYNYQIGRPYYGTPVKPRFVAPAVPQEPKLAPAPAPPLEEPEPVTPLTAVEPPKPIDPPAPVTTEKIIVVRDALPEVSVENEVDALNARLAKIQLERHNLAETLKLIAKIKSETFKVKTLVDLAEYVSRDRNYSFEAQHLYSLAVKGIDTLNRNEVLEFETDIVVPPPVTPPAPKSEIVEAKPEPIAEPDPIVEKPAPPVKTPVPVEEKEDAAPEDFTIPAPPVKAPTSVEVYEDTKPADPAPVKKPKPGIMLQDEPEKPAPTPPAPVLTPPTPEVEEEPKPAPKPVRKPIPGKKITLEEN